MEQGICSMNVSTPAIFLNDPKSSYRVFCTLIVFSGGELPWDKKCVFSSFLWVWKHPWSRVKRCHFVSISFHRLWFCIHFLSWFMFLSCCICGLSFCIHFLSYCFHVLSCSVTKPVRCVYVQALVFFHISLSLLLSFSYRFGGLCRLPSSGFMNIHV